MKNIKVFSVIRFIKFDSRINNDGTLSLNDVEKLNELYRF